MIPKEESGGQATSESKNEPLKVLHDELEREEREFMIAEMNLATRMYETYPDDEEIVKSAHLIRDIVSKRLVTRVLG